MIHVKWHWGASRINSHHNKQNYIGFLSGPVCVLALQSRASEVLLSRSSWYKTAETLTSLLQRRIARLAFTLHYELRCMAHSRMAFRTRQNTERRPTRLDARLHLAAEKVTLLRRKCYCVCQTQSLISSWGGKKRTLKLTRTSTSNGLRVRLL